MHRKLQAGLRVGDSWRRREHTPRSVRRAIGLVVVNKRFVVDEQALGVDRYVFVDEDGFDG